MGGSATAGVAAAVCGFRRSTETHCRVAPISRSSFFFSLISTRYGPRYVASSGLSYPHVHVGSLLYPTSCTFSASLAGLTLLGMITFSGGT